MKIALLAGGTGAAKLARGLATLIPPLELSIVTNTADDDEFWGLLVSPDTDAVLYRLAGIFNDAAGFGVRDETFHALEMLGRLQEPTWFGLGDRDLGLHLLRDSLLRRGARLSEAVAEISRRLDIGASVIPMSDGRVRTRIITDDGELSLQSWFVQHRCSPPFRGCRLEGIDVASASPEATAAVQRADAVIIGPSNPVISVEPILALLRQHLVRDRVVAVSPVVGGRSLKGPTIEMLRSVHGEATALTVARRYAGIAQHFVLDARDGALADDIAELGMTVHVLDTVMGDEDAERRFAGELARLLTDTVGARAL